MAWERPQADKRWDDLAVAHIDEIAKGLRPREFEKKLVELLDPTLMQAPPSATGQEKSDSSSLQHECFARARSGKKHPRFETVPRDDRSSKS